MNFEDLKGTEKLVFERLLELRKKLYKFRHEETTCSENSLSGSLPLELKSMSDLNIAKIESAFCRTAQFVFKEKKDSDSFSDVAGIVFGVSGSEKYRAGLTDLLKSEKLSSLKSVPTGGKCGLVVFQAFCRILKGFAGSKFVNARLYRRLRHGRVGCWFLTSFLLNMNFIIFAF